MSSHHRYTLEPYRGLKSRYTCPRCQHRCKTFKRYIDTQTNTHLADHVGRCDRADKCGYHYTPKEFFNATPGFVSHKSSGISTVEKHTYNVLPMRLVEACMKGNQCNHFLHFLGEMLGDKVTAELACRYHIGTSKHWPGAVVFWQIDIQGKVRTGKVMLYDKHTGKRVKQPYNHIAWAHILVGKTGSPKVRKQEYRNENQLSDLCGLPDFRTQKNFTLKQCFFGEHLLQTDPWKTVAICESEKTAVLGSYFMPNYLWLAAGSLEGLTTDKCRVLKNREVRLFPDVNAYAKWHEKAQLLNGFVPSARFTTDQTLELTATPNERTLGIDLADRWITQILTQ